MNFKNILSWFVIGLILAFAGVIFSEIMGEIFNGFPYGTGAVVGMGAYLCVIVITCTGIIVTKLDHSSDSGNDDKNKK